MDACKNVNKKFLILLFIGAFLLRAGVFWGYLGQDQRYYQIDSKIYDEVAQNIAAGHGISRDDGSPNVYRVPGYPLYLAACYKLGLSHTGVLWIQVLLGSLIPVLVYLLALILFSWLPLLAYAASSVTAIHLGLVLYAGFLMTETFFVLLFLLFLLLYCYRNHLRWCSQEREHDPNRETYGSVSGTLCPDPMCYSEVLAMVQEDLVFPDYPQGVAAPYLQIFCAGIILGLASLIRPVGPYVVILALGMLCLLREFGLSRLRKGILLFAGWAVAVAPWIIRNYLLFGQFFFHTLPGPHFLNLSASRVQAKVANQTYWQARAALNDRARNLALVQERTQGEPMDKVQFSRIREKLAISIFLKHPIIALHVWGIDIMRTALSLYSAELLFLESGRKHIDYFALDRTVTSFFTRYLFPPTEKIWLKLVIWWEILFSLLLWFGLGAGVVTLVYEWCYARTDIIRAAVCAWLRVLPFALLFIVLGLSGGYSRIRLPTEPLLIILSLYVWVAWYAARNKRPPINETIKTVRPAVARRAMADRPDRDRRRVRRSF